MSVCRALEGRVGALEAGAGASARRVAGEIALRDARIQVQWGLGCGGTWWGMGHSLVPLESFCQIARLHLRQAVRAVHPHICILARPASITQQPSCTCPWNLIATLLHQSAVDKVGLKQTTETPHTSMPDALMSDPGGCICC